MINLIENNEDWINEYSQVLTIDRNPVVFEGYEDDYILRELSPEVFKNVMVAN